ncbi:MAG TPA: glycosyltransferase [Ktedonobacterales bacterium]|jgi:glycosyltransferase involved in cell wall biosynthesis
MGQSDGALEQALANPPAAARPLRILYLMEQLDMGGAERRFVRMARMLNRDQMQLVVGVLRPGGALEADLHSLGVEIVPFTRHGRFDPSPVWRLAHYVRKERIDVVHAMHWLSSLVAMLAAWQIPHLAVIGSTVNLFYDKAPAGKYRLMLDHLFWRRMDYMAVNALALRDYLVQRRFPEKRLMVIANGVDIPDTARLSPATREAARAALGVPPHAPLIGTVARLEPAKNLQMLLHAARAVCARFPDARFVLVGNGSERAPLEALAATLGISEKVLFTGEVAHSDLVLPAFDVFVLCSRFEGMPNVLLEAGAWGLPLISTPVGGTVEIVLDEKTGFLTPMGDAPALAERIGALLERPDLAAAFGHAARAHVMNHFSSSTMIQRYEALYRMAAEARAMRGRSGL